MTRAWAFLSKFDIRDEQTGELYLRRWRIIQTPWFAIYLHKMATPDKDRDLHDHPWPFLSWVLWGGYDEQLGERWRGGYWVPLSRHAPKLVRRGWLSIGLRHAEDPHRIIRLHKSPTWTLVLTGKRRRSWGFYTDKGFVDWKVYLGVSEQGGA